MAVVKVAASTASWTSWPPRSAAVTASSPSSRWRKMFSSTTTELSIKRESTSASPPSTMVLMVPPVAFRSRNAARQEIGIDSSTETVPRTEPRKIRIITAVSTRPMPPSRKTLATAVFTYCDWSNTTFATSELGNVEQFLDALADAVDDLDGVAVAALLEDGKIDRLLAVDAHDVVLDGGRVFGVADIGEAQDAVANRLSAEHRSSRRCWAVGCWCKCCSRAGRCERLLREGCVLASFTTVHHIHRAQLCRLQLHRIDIELDLAVLSAEGLWHRCARHIGNLVADGELPQIVQLGFI